MDPIIFLEGCLSGHDSGLVSLDGLVINSSGVFQSPGIPLEISVKSLGPEMESLDSGTGLKTGDFDDPARFPSTNQSSRKLCVIPLE